MASARDITPESLTLFSLLEPRLDVLVIGIGDGSIKPPDTPGEWELALLGYRINFVDTNRQFVSAPMCVTDRVIFVV